MPASFLPLDVGVRIRNFHLLRAYADIGKVRLLFYYEDETELAGLETLEPYVSEFQTVRFDWYGRPSRPELSQWLKDLRENQALLPFISSVRFTREMRKAVERIAPKCALIHVSRLGLLLHAEAFLKPKSGDQRVVLDLDDVETQLLRRSLRVAPAMGWRARSAAYCDLMLLEWYQRRALQRCDNVFVCSEQDRLLLGSRPRTTVIPNGTDLAQRPLPDETEGRTVLCLGTYGHWPNVDGLKHFLKCILPLIQQEMPEVRLLVVGKDMPPEVAQLHDGTKILVAANVPSVEQYYRAATISVIPLHVAGGTRLRILEAFALGRAVVSTSIGCDGLGVVHNEHLLVADEPGVFAQACLALLRTPALRARLVARARALAEQQYSWESVRQRVADVVTGLIEDVRSASRARSKP